MLRISHKLTSLSAEPVATRYSLNGENATQFTSAECAYTVVAGVSYLSDRMSQLQNNPKCQSPHSEHTTVISHT